MKKIITLVVAVLAVAFTVYTAYAVVNDGRPGRFDMSFARIDARGEGDGRCFAQYEDPVTQNGFTNTFISDCCGADDTQTKVTENNNGANAWCKFTDTSGVYEDNAEVGDILDCMLITEEGTYINGTGQVTAAANNNPRQTLSVEGDGGNVTIHCKFDAEDFIANP
jgi:hypothetical protein